MRIALRARRQYGGRPRPGAALARPEDHAPAAERARFAVLDATIAEIETLHPGDVHRRARFARGDGFGGRWVAPLRDLANPGGLA